MTTKNEPAGPDTLHNIEYNLQQVVEKVQKDLVGNAYRIALAGLVLVLAISGVVSTGLLNVQVPSAVLGVLAAGYVLRLAYLRIEVEPHSRLLDEHLALLAEIGFNERKPGKGLQTQLKENGYITLGHLKQAQKTYRADNVKKYHRSLANEKGAQKFLVGAE